MSRRLVGTPIVPEQSVYHKFRRTWTNQRSQAVLAPRIAEYSVAGILILFQGTGLAVFPVAFSIPVSIAIVVTLTMTVLLARSVGSS